MVDLPCVCLCVCVSVCVSVCLCVFAFVQERKISKDCQEDEKTNTRKTTERKSKTEIETVSAFDGIPLVAVAYQLSCYLSFFFATRRLLVLKKKIMKTDKKRMNRGKNG